MAITVENVFDVSATREHGRIVRLRRAVIIKGLTSTDPTNYIEEISQSDEIPRSAITVDGSSLSYKSEDITVGDDSALGDARVDINYEQTSSSFGQSSTGTNPTLRGGTTLKQVQTELDADGAQITVSHEWPDDATGVYPDGTSKAGTTETQGGSISVMVPMSSLSGSFRFATPTPGAITKRFAGRVNKTKWQDGEPRTWMCTQALFELVDDSVSPPIWEFHFAFEYDEKTWDNDTAAIFVDSSTGEPPSGLVIGTGIKKILYYPELNFNDFF